MTVQKDGKTRSLITESSHPRITSNRRKAEYTHNFQNSRVSNTLNQIQCDPEALRNKTEVRSSKRRPRLCLPCSFQLSYHTCLSTHKRPHPDSGFRTSDLLANELAKSTHTDKCAFLILLVDF